MCKFDEICYYVYCDVYLDSGEGHGDGVKDVDVSVESGSDSPLVVVAELKNVFKGVSFQIF